MTTPSLQIDVYVYFTGVPANMRVDPLIADERLFRGMSKLWMHPHIGRSLDYPRTLIIDNTSFGLFHICD